MNDDDLQARLQASDPAASLPPADPHRVAQLLEDAMTTDLATESRDTRETPRRNRNPATWLVAAAAVLAIAGSATVAALTGDDTTIATPARSVTELDLQPGQGAIKCMVPNAAVLASADVAFAGTVTVIDGDQVTLETTHWYTGTSTETVIVTAPSAQLSDVTSGIKFQQGDRYLVSANDGQITLCGFSADYTDDLANLYTEAFPS